MEQKSDVPTVNVSFPILLSLYEDNLEFNLDSWVNIRGNVHDCISPLMVRALFTDFTKFSNITQQQMQQVMQSYGYTTSDAMQFFRQLIQSKEELTFAQFYDGLKYGNIEEKYREFLYALVNKPHRYTSRKTIKLNSIKKMQNALNNSNHHINQQQINTIINSYGALLFAQSPPSMDWIESFLSFTSNPESHIVMSNITICLCLYIYMYYGNHVKDIKHKLLTFIFNVILNDECAIGTKRFESFVCVCFYMIHCGDNETFFLFLTYLHDKTVASDHINIARTGLYVFSYIIGCIMAEGEQRLDRLVLNVLKAVFHRHSSDKHTCQMVSLLFKLMQLKISKICIPLDSKDAVELHAQVLINASEMMYLLNWDKYKGKQLSILDINCMYEQILTSVKYHYAGKDRYLNRKLIPVDIMQHKMESKLKNKVVVSKLGGNFMASVLEYLCVELVEVSGKYCDRSRRRIDEKSINRMLVEDAEMRELFIDKIPIEKTIPYDNEDTDSSASVSVNLRLDYDKSWLDPNKPFKCHKCRKGYPSKCLLIQHKTNVCGTTQ